MRGRGYEMEKGIKEKNEFRWRDGRRLNRRKMRMER